MSFVISSAFPFPEIAWWCHVLSVEKVRWDVTEHFQKMTNRNRYTISSANGPLKLSLPLEGGRDQRSVMQNILISNTGEWQKQHWRTLVSAYNRSPYFEFYAPSLKLLFTTKADTLVEFNLSSVRWIKQQLKLNYDEETLTSYEKAYPGALCDLRQKALIGENALQTFPQYSQVFGERTGFLPNLSLLDLLFAEGPYTLQWLRGHCEKILKG